MEVSLGCGQHTPTPTHLLGVNRQPHPALDQSTGDPHGADDARGGDNDLLPDLYGRKDKDGNRVT